MPYLALVLLFLLSEVQPSQARAPLAIALVDISGNAAVRTPSLARALLEKELGKSDRFRLVERERVKEVLEEISFQQSGVTEGEGAVELGRQLNVSHIFFVQTHPGYPTDELSVRIVEVATGQILRVETEPLGRRPAEVRAAVRQLARRLRGIAPLLYPEEMALIPAGIFLMGSAEGLAEERPPHQVSVKSFYLDRFEVNRISFEEFLVAQQRKSQADLTHPDLPATQVSWEEAAAYCQAQGKRLPTEAEWEYAARGTEGRSYPWGEAAPTPSLARFEADGPLPVDSLPAGATPEGVYHLAGNVAEWVQDWWDPEFYAISPAQNPTGPEVGDYRVVRGGSWDQPAAELRATARAYHNPDRGAAHIGFRCARTVPPEP